MKKFIAVAGNMGAGKSELVGFLCRRYDLASGCRGLRPESLRITVENRLGKRAA